MTHPTATEQAEREAFETQFRHLSLAKKVDAWGRPTYFYRNVESVWHGWQARALLPKAAQPVDDAQQVCAEAYQAVGVILSDLGLFDSAQGQKLLDNLSEARKVHDDVLPWAAQPAPVAVPEGWKLVPIVPILDMIDAAIDESNTWPAESTDYGGLYAAMLSAAPTPKEPS